MRTLRRRSSHDEAPAASAPGAPIVLATLDVPFADEAIELAVDAAVESGRPLVVVNAAEVLLTPATLVGYGYIEREDLQTALNRPVTLARSLAVPVERLRVCSPHPVDALAAVVAERRPAMLVFGPDRSRLRRRAYARATRRISRLVTCLLWVAD